MSSTAEFPNKYSQFLVCVGKLLTSEDLSAILLVLQTNKRITLKEQKGIKNSMDLLSFLDRRQFIKKNNLSFLQKLLEVIHRADILRELDRYKQLLRNSLSGGTCEESYQVLTVQPSSAHNSQEDKTELKLGDANMLMGGSAADIMDIAEDSDFILPSSQDSITDDDKLALW